MSEPVKESKSVLDKIKEIKEKILPPVPKAKEYFYDPVAYEKDPKHKGTKRTGDQPFLVGDYVVGLPSARRYAYTSKGVLCYVSNIPFGRSAEAHYVSRGELCGCPECVEDRKYPSVTLIALVDKCPEGRAYNVCTRHFRLATSEEVEMRREEVTKAREYAKGHGFKTGDAVVLTQDTEVSMTGMFACGNIILRKGVEAIVDLAPGEVADTVERDLGNLSSGRGDLTEAKDVVAGEFKLRDFVAPQVNLYFPDTESEHYVGITAIKKRENQLDESRLILPDGYMERIMTATRRVTDEGVHEYLYDKLGLHKVCQKGRGALILLYGPPGCGKTATAEALCEKIGRPLIKLTLGSLSNSEAIKEKLAQTFTRAKRYRAVLLLDEVDVFIRARGSHPVFDENTSVFLRMLEYYDGILVMTSNLANQIDKAVFSRIHVALEYAISGAVERRQIWDCMLPKELRETIVGGEKAVQRMLDEVKEIDINGREIKTVIQNAVGRAISSYLPTKEGEMRPEEFKAAPKFIQPKLFIEEAKMLYDQRSSLNKMG